VRYAVAWCIEIVEFVICLIIVQTAVVLVIPYENHSVAAAVIVCGISFPCSAWLVWRSFVSRTKKIETDHARERKNKPDEKVP
jgi:hypothetical protein